jgi:hypothetical protein
MALVQQHPRLRNHGGVEHLHGPFHGEAVRVFQNLDLRLVTADPHMLRAGLKKTGSSRRTWA